MTYRDRAAAGGALATRLIRYAGRTDTIVLGLVRGGVPVAQRIAAVLGAPLDILVIRRLGVPWAPEVTFGALGPGGTRVLNPEVVAGLRVDDVDGVTAQQAAELARYQALYRAGRPALDLAARVAVIVDDGLATGTTARAAIAAARALGAARVVLAVPVGAADGVALVTADADEVVCPLIVRLSGPLGGYYQHFGPVGDREVAAALAAPVG